MKQWKKFVCGIWSSILLIGNVCPSAWATEEGDWVVDDITLVLQDDGTAWITNCFQSAKSVDVPAEADGIAITGIAEGAFSECYFLEKLTLPDSITTIQDSAFFGCSSLKELKIPDSVTTIGNGILESCSALKQVTFPSNLEKLPTSTFYSCTALETITLPEHITTIEQEAFYQCTALKEISFSDQLQSIEKYAFEGCSALTTVHVPANCSTLGDFVFEGCTALTKIEVAEDNVNYMDVDGVLFTKDGSVLLKYPDAHAQTNYVVPEECKKLEDWCFTGAASLQSVDISGIEEMGSDVFFYCQSLESVVIPDSIKELPNNTFAYCTELTDVTLPATLERIGDYCFYTCVRLNNLTLPNALKEIGQQAFFNCLELTHLTIPDKVTEIGTNAFGLYAESQDEAPSPIKNFSVTYNGNSKIKKYVNENHIPAEATGNAMPGWVLPVVIVGVCVLVAAVVVIFVLRKKRNRKGGTA